MAQNNQNWDDLGQTIQQIVDSAVNRQDFARLNQTITQAIDRAMDVGSEVVRTVVEGNAPAASRIRREKQVPAERPKPETLYAKTGGKMAAGIVSIVGGGLLTLVTFGTVLSGLILNLVVSGSGFLGASAVAALLGFGSGLTLLGSGIGRLKTVSRFKAYCRVLGSKTHCALESLGQQIGKSEKYVRRDVQKMIRQGWFLQGHMDKEQTRLITTHETYRQFEQSRLQLEQRQKEEQIREKQKKAANHSPQVQEVLDRGNAFVKEIRRCNDAIPGHEISAKISRMELIVERIFQRANAHPEIVPDLKKMMDYYLPMTVKLLNAYADMDAQPVQGENIRNAKREIEDSLDTLNLAFEKLLDSVFAETALDISSDISVLNTLLAQEGLTQDGMKL